MSDRRRVIVVSNRAPSSYAREDGRRVARRGAGGLVTALGPLVSHHDVTWLASAISDEDRAVAAEGTIEETAHGGSRYRLRLIDHPPEAYDLYYNVVANPLLWFVQHGLSELLHEPAEDLERAWHEGYRPVNEAFADAVVDELEREPGVVLFHDYHLYLAPALVRGRRPDAALSHFTHVPWVGPDAWSVLPETIVRAIHEGLLAADVTGFHTRRWREAFLESSRALGLDPDEERVTAHPISIDPAEFTALAQSGPVLERERELVTGRPEQLILRVDRTDPSKNVPRGLEAFGRLLERRPDLRGMVRMLALLDPSRQAIPEYLEERRRIEAAAASVEERFPGALVVRISDDFPASVAAYKQFDVLLVNAVMDGLNLVVKEAAVVNERAGVVALSVNAGAFEELAAWVVPVEPLDVDATADALEQALALGEDERRARQEAIRAQVREHDLERWLSAQLADLDRASSMSRP
ncbi:MAG: trehalose-6-phosphate synthase [Thermoleophilia bacterium]|nr:trehalose-6-phosphate synthase [Thermoleophilia bacterium]